MCIEKEMDMNQKVVLETLKRLAADAGKIIMEIYETDFEVDYKEDESPLTMADKQANNLIVKELAEQFPECAILSEEMKDDKKGGRRNTVLSWILLMVQRNL